MLLSVKIGLEWLKLDHWTKFLSCTRLCSKNLIRYFPCIHLINILTYLLCTITLMNKSYYYFQVTNEQLSHRKSNNMTKSNSWLHSWDSSLGSLLHSVSLTTKICCSLIGKKVTRGIELHFEVRIPGSPYTDIWSCRTYQRWGYK